MNLTAHTKEYLTDLYEDLLTKIFNDDMILAMPARTPEQFEAWQAAMRTGIHPTHYRLMADVVNEIKARKGMRNRKMPVRKSRRGRKFVGTPTFLL